MLFGPRALENAENLLNPLQNFCKCFRIGPKRVNNIEDHMFFNLSVSKFAISSHFRFFRQNFDFTRRSFDFALRTIDFAQRTIDFTLRTIDFTLRNFDFALRNFGFIQLFVQICSFGTIFVFFFHFQ